MPRKRVILTAGGTGGHLFPAQALAQTLAEKCDILFVGGGLSTSPYFDTTAYSFEEISCSTFSFSKPLKVLTGGRKIIKGFRQSRTILRRFNPDVVVGFGSFYTLPVLLAARAHRVPIILHEQNTIPGKVNRLFSRCAHTTAITFSESANYLKGNCIEVAFPLRKQTLEISPWDYFALSPDRVTLLVFGGSQGAIKLNTLFLASIEKLPPSIQVLHFTGKQGLVEEAKARYRAMGIAHSVKAFEPYLASAMQIADIAVTRAGAATLAELIETETPAILIPFPFATENHQEKNGKHFVEKVGGGSMYLEPTLDADQLSKIMAQFLKEDYLLKKKNIQQYKKEHQVKELSHLILESIL